MCRARRAHTHALTHHDTMQGGLPNSSRLHDDKSTQTAASASAPGPISLLDRAQPAAAPSKQYGHAHAHRARARAGYVYGNEATHQGAGNITRGMRWVR